MLSTESHLDQDKSRNDTDFQGQTPLLGHGPPPSQTDPHAWEHHSLHQWVFLGATAPQRILFEERSLPLKGCLLSHGRAVTSSSS